MDNRFDSKKMERWVEETDPLIRVWNIENKEGAKDTKDN